jgi:hypothetical protein
VSISDSRPAPLPIEDSRQVLRLMSGYLNVSGKVDTYTDNGDITHVHIMSILFLAI